MPSLWKKQKGNKISRLAADFQTPPKQGGSLVVENGFSTSLVDLFQKNKNKLRKPSTKKKLRFKKNQNNNTNNNVEDHSICQEYDPNLPLVSHTSSSNLEGSTYLNYNYNNGDDDGDHNMCKNSMGQYYDADIFIEEIIESCDEFEDDKEKSGIYLNKNVFWLSVWIGTIVSGVALYNKKIVLGITLATLLLFLLEYVRNSVFRLFKHCENGALLLSSKGALVAVVVGLSTRKFVLGIGISVLSLVVLELVGKMIFRLFRPNSNEESRGFDGCERGKVVEDSSVGGDDMEVLNEGIEVPLKEEDREEGNSSELRGIVQEDDEVNGTTREWILEGENNGSILMRADFSSIEEDVMNKSTYQFESLESNYSEWPREPIFCDPSTNVGELPRKKGKKEKWYESAYVVDENGKVKKKKFWKKLVSKHLRKKKKYKHERELDGTSTEQTIDSAELELEEEDEPVLEDGTLEIIDEEISSISSSTDEEEDNEIDLNVPPNRSCYTMLQIESRIKSCRWMEKVKDGNLKCFILVAIPLTGLIQGRIFALILTVISCVVFKIVRG